MRVLPWLALAFLSSYAAAQPQPVLPGELEEQGCRELRNGYTARVLHVTLSGTPQAPFFETLFEEYGPRGNAMTQSTFRLKPRTYIKILDGNKRSRVGSLADLRRGDWVTVIGRCAPGSPRTADAIVIKRKANGLPGGPQPRSKKMSPADATLVGSELRRQGGDDIWAACDRVNLFEACATTSFGGEMPPGPPISLYNALAVPLSGPAGARSEEVCAGAGLSSGQCKAVLAELPDAKRHGLVKWGCSGRSEWSTQGSCMTPAGACRSRPPARYTERPAEGPRDVPLFISGPQASCESGQPRFSPCFCHSAIDLADGGSDAAETGNDEFTALPRKKAAERLEEVGKSWWQSMALTPEDSAGRAKLHAEADQLRKEFPGLGPDGGSPCDARLVTHETCSKAHHNLASGHKP